MLNQADTIRKREMTMTNLQLLLTICIPSFLVLVGILLNYKGTSDVAKRLDIIEHDLRVFYSVTGKLEGQVETLMRK